MSDIERAREIKRYYDSLPPLDLGPVTPGIDIAKLIRDGIERKPT